MSTSMRICLFSPGPGSLCEPFEAIEGVVIVHEVATWPELKDAIRRTRPDTVVVQLDAEEGLDVVQRTKVVAPWCGILGVSSDSNPVSIIKAMRTGCDQFVPWPPDQQDLCEALGRIHVESNRPAVDVSRRICLIGAAGGAGTTTIACNLAIELAELVGQPCGMVDLNLEFGDVGCFFDCKPQYTVSDLCREGAEIDTLMIDKGFHELPSKVAVLVRPQGLGEFQVVKPGGVEAVLGMAGQTFPFVVVDLPRSMNEVNMAAVSGSDVILIVTQLGVPFIRNATRMYDSLLSMGVPSEHIEIVLNRTRSNFGRVTPQDVEAHFKKPVLAMIPNDYRRAQASLDLGHSMTADTRKSPIRLAIQELARTLAGDGDFGQGQSSPGFLRRLLGGKPKHETDVNA